MPIHLKRICLLSMSCPPDIDFEVWEQSEPRESVLSQGLESHHLSGQSSHDGASMLEDADSQSSHAGSRDVTPDTSLSQRVEHLKNRGKVVGLWNYIRTGRLIDFNLVMELDKRSSRLVCWKPLNDIPSPKRSYVLLLS